MDDADISRFEKYIDKSGECWLWTGALDKDGYGKSWLDGKSIRSHRFSYLLANGELPPSPLIVRHKCKLKNCCNPDHLESGTQYQNAQDRVRDGTVVRGEKSSCSKLTEQKVLEIRRRYAENREDLAKEFGVRPDTIGDIIYERSWSWLE